MRDVNSHDREMEAVGRTGVPWYPTLPTFVGTAFEGAPGWKPTPSSLEASVAWLKETLGERLVGLNFWSLDRKLYDMQQLYQSVASIKAPKRGPEAPSEPTARQAWMAAIDSWARGMGYSGPGPLEGLDGD